MGDILGLLAALRLFAGTRFRASPLDRHDAYLDRALAEGKADVGDPTTALRQERSTKTTDKRAAERILAQWCTAATLRREGVIDSRAEALTEHGRAGQWHGRHGDKYYLELNNPHQ